MEQGWDNDVKHFFVKILNSIAWTLIWAIAAATAGLYFELGLLGDKPVWPSIIFYIVLAVTLVALVRYLYRTWKQS